MLPIATVKIMMVHFDFSLMVSREKQSNWHTAENKKNTILLLNVVCYNLARNLDNENIYALALHVEQCSLLVNVPQNGKQELLKESLNNS